MRKALSQQKAATKKLFSFPFPLSVLIIFISIFFIFPFSAQNAQAADVTLAWDQNPESDVIGYKVYYGTSSGSYSTTVDVGNYTSCVISGLDIGETYYFVATAYTSEDESGYSDESAHTVPANSIGNDSSDGDDGGGCFIATAAYGSYVEPDVMVLREIRDKYLLTNAPGMAFVRFYYRTSPPVADYIRDHEALRVITRWTLTPVIYAAKYPKIFLLIIISALLLLFYVILKKSIINKSCYRSSIDNLVKSSTMPTCRHYNGK